jgi:hypothetical protein
MFFSNIINLAMAIMYISCGIFLLVGENIFNFSDFQKSGLGYTLLAYGLFRLYSFFNKYKESKKDDKD